MRLLFTLTTFFGAITRIFAQLPSDLPYETDPVDFTSTTAIIFYILVPVIMFVFYYMWRKKKLEELRNKKNGEEDNEG